MDSNSVKTNNNNNFCYVEFSIREVQKNHVHTKCMCIIIMARFNLNNITFGSFLTFSRVRVLYDKIQEVIHFNFH